MVEAHDKNGPPKLRIEVHCGHAECGYVGTIEGEKADAIASRLWSPRWKGKHDGHLHIRQLIAKLVCKKCRHRFASVHFKLVYRPDPMNRRASHDHRQWIPDYWT